MGHKVVSPTGERISSFAIPAERLADILDIAEDGIVTVNEAQEIVLFNRGAAKIFGYAPPEILGKSLDLLIPSRFHARHRGYMEEFARTGVVSRLMGERRPVFGVRKDGSEFPAEISISKLAGPDGTSLFTAIVRDITERKQHEEAILRLNQELEERVRARTAELAERNLQLSQKNEENEMFVYSVSHDLRSPLVNLEGFSEELLTVSRDLQKLLADANMPAEVRARAAKIIDEGMVESIGFIRTAVGRLSRIIDALLRLSRAGRVVYQHAPLEMDAVVRRVVDALRRTAEDKQAEVKIGKLPPANGDAAAVEQVFANLVGNALNYLDSSRPGVVEVGTVGTPPDEANHARALTTYFVKDNGVGIPRAYLPKLFQPFQRLHPEASPGEGIGLAIARRVVDRLGGKLWAESTEGQGTTFFLTLPAVNGTVGND